MASKGTRSQSAEAEDMERAAGPVTPTPKTMGKLRRTPPTTVAIGRHTAVTTRKGKGRQRVVHQETSEDEEVSADTLEEEAGPSATPAEEEEEHEDTREADLRRRERELRSRERRQEEKEGRGRDAPQKDTEDGLTRQRRQARQEEEEEEEERMTVKDLMKRMSHFGSKISMRLTGTENYTI